MGFFSFVWAVLCTLYEYYLLGTDIVITKSPNLGEIESLTNKVVKRVKICLQRTRHCFLVLLRVNRRYLSLFFFQTRMRHYHIRVKFCTSAVLV